MKPELTSQHARIPVEVPAGAPDWVTPELLSDTLRTWQPSYAHTLTVEEALEILLSVVHLFDQLRNVECGDDDSVSGPG